MRIQPSWDSAQSSSPSKPIVTTQPIRLRGGPLLVFLRRVTAGRLVGTPGACISPSSVRLLVTTTLRMGGSLPGRAGSVPASHPPHEPRMTESTSHDHIPDRVGDE